ncbi:MAG: hypothetical protein KC492_28575 [Myxococcales bacterium]|nr:hypothetical protein [Myxococcales bacterium]
MNIPDAITAFRQAAVAKAEFSVPAARDHALHAEMARAWQVLSSHGPPGLEAFRVLLSDPSPHVRCWTASQLLALGHEHAFAVLEALVADDGPCSFSSKIVLREWRAGGLKPPL